MSFDVKIDTIIADAARFAAMAEPFVVFFLVAQKASGVGGATAAEAIAVIQAAVQAIEKAAAGHVTSTAVLDELAALKAGLASNDAAADAALQTRFPAVP